MKLNQVNKVIIRMLKNYNMHNLLTKEKNLFINDDNINYKDYYNKIYFYLNIVFLDLLRINDEKINNSFILKINSKAAKKMDYLCYKSFIYFLDKNNLLMKYYLDFNIGKRKFKNKNIIKDKILKSLINEQKQYDYIINYQSIMAIYYTDVIIPFKTQIIKALFNLNLNDDKKNSLKKRVYDKLSSYYYTKKIKIRSVSPILDDINDEAKIKLINYINDYNSKIDYFNKINEKLIYWNNKKIIWENFINKIIYG